MPNAYTKEIKDNLEQWYFKKKKEKGRTTHHKCRNDWKMVDLPDNIVGDEQGKQKRAGVVSRRQRAQGKKLWKEIKKWKRDVTSTTFL